MQKKTAAVPPMYRKAASALCDLVYRRTAELMESRQTGRAPFKKMHDDIVAEVVPGIWPKLTSLQMAKLSAFMPLVNYIKQDKPRTTREIIETLIYVIPPQSASPNSSRRKVAAASTKRSRSRARSGKSRSR
ncbi:MAG TPA: hypothetical protein VHO24_06230 [Opitutaceae bacterium]|nr:hypothetical protein [Opitutaceae bacterium]